jgi:hypothetical protein
MASASGEDPEVISLREPDNVYATPLAPHDTRARRY